VALDPGTVAAFRAHRKCQLEERLSWGAAYEDCGLVFARENGHPLHPETISAQFARHAAAAGLKPIRLHDLRHSYASAALAAGVHVKVVSEQLGHSTVALTLDVYSHVIPALAEDAAERVAALLD
jgi:integrase